MKIAAILGEDNTDPDVFWYTELLDRNSTRGSNQARMAKTFYHQNGIELLAQFPQIQALCDKLNVRAYTRLAPRSYKAVGKHFTSRIVELAMQEQWRAMKRMYSSALGTVKPVRALWLFDVDDPTTDMAHALEVIVQELDVLVTKVPSRQGHHLVVKPHHVVYMHPNIDLHKDNPVNLYIPEGAA